MSLGTHRAVEFGVGVVAAVAALILAISSSDGGVVATVALAIVWATVGMAPGSAAPGPKPTSHLLFDRILLGAFALLAVILLLAGDWALGLVNLAAALAEA